MLLRWDIALLYSLRYQPCRIFFLSPPYICYCANSVTANRYVLIPIMKGWHDFRERLWFYFHCKMVVMKGTCLNNWEIFLINFNELFMKKENVASSFVSHMHLRGWGRCSFYIIINGMLRLLLNMIRLCTDFRVTGCSGSFHSRSYPKRCQSVVRKRTAAIYNPPSPIA